jgi:phytoene dehydrogenase-like protein
LGIDSGAVGFVSTDARARRARTRLDAVVIGAGPNGLAAALTLARAGRSVLVIEARQTVGGSARTSELTLPGFRHDVCSAIHPLAAASPFLRSLELDLIDPPAALAHPLDDGSAVVVRRSLHATARELGADEGRYRGLLEPFVTQWREVADDLLRPIIHAPRHRRTLARFARIAVRSAEDIRFRTEEARALFAGAAAHSVIPLDRRGTAGFGLLLLTLAHAVGWPVARGGSQSIADMLADRVRDAGGEIETGREITSLHELPPSRIVLCDITPRQLLSLAGERLPPRYRRKLEGWRYGPGVFKVDYALDAPIPWRAPEVAEAGTVHLGGSASEIAHSEDAAWRGTHTDRPFVLLAQQSLFDDTRAPAGKHTAWAYCHVPHGSKADITEQIEAQIERFAPGFRNRVVARKARGPAELAHDNANLVGGDISGGANTLAQLVRRFRYATPVPGLYLCSAATPPGAGVHGMCGHLAARAALQRLH